MMWDPYSAIKTPEEIADHCRRFKATFAEKMYAKIRCSFCTKLRGEHSEAEVAACVEALLKNVERRSKRLEARKLLEEAHKLRPE